MAKIEILFPEYCNLFGDSGNMRYLKKCIPNETFYETSFDEEPRFVKEDVDMIYMGPMTEDMQERVIKKLEPYKSRIEELIEKNVVFLIIGNAVEIFINEIKDVEIKPLNIFNFKAERHMLDRHNSYFVGKFEDIDIVGFKSQFTFLEGDNSNCYFAKVERGIGINKESKFEGIRRNNFFGTYTIGPILVLNPDFTLEIQKRIGVEEPKLAFEKEVREAYNLRLKELLEKK